MRYAMLAVMAACGGRAATMNPTNSSPSWQEVNAKNVFTFRSPLPVEEMRSRGIDSLVGRYQIGDCVMRFDYGIYGNTVQPWSVGWPSDYRHRVTQLSGKRARWATWSDPHDDGTTHHVGIHLPSLTVFANCKGPAQVPTMIQIFETIRSNRLEPDDVRKPAPHGGPGWTSIEECRVEASTAGRIAVRAVDERGRPAREAFVYARPADGEAFDTSTDAGGAAMLEVPPGRYEVSVSTPVITIDNGYQTLHAGTTAAAANCRDVAPGSTLIVRLRRF